MTPIYYDEEHRQIPTVDFPFDEVGKSMGDEDVGSDEYFGVDVIHRIPGELLWFIANGHRIPRCASERPARDRLLTLRFFAYLYLSEHESVRGKTVKMLAEEQALHANSLKVEVVNARRAIGANRMLKNLMGTGAKRI